jgi:Na+/H+-translocating membrane pyrophosphatase
MLPNFSFELTFDGYGPISDNAQSIAEMAILGDSNQ